MATLYQEVRRALESEVFKPRKRFGQNFLIDARVIEAILRLLELQPEDGVVEIGPGLGFVTRRLVERAACVWAVEIDRFLVEWLRQADFGANPRLHLIHDDILHVAPENFLPEGKVKLVGNLPYNISTAVLFRIFDWREHFSSLVLMVQKEVADRIAAQPASKAYGTLSVWTQVHARIAAKVEVAPGAFFPRPRVRSTILKLEMLPQALAAEKDLPALRAIVRGAFGQRRKTLANALGSALNVERRRIEELLRAREIDPNARGETLAAHQFVALARSARELGLAGGQIGDA